MSSRQCDLRHLLTGPRGTFCDLSAADLALPSTRHRVRLRVLPVQRREWMLRRDQGRVLRTTCTCYISWTALAYRSMRTTRYALEVGKAVANYHLRAQRESRQRFDENSIVVKYILLKRADIHYTFY